LGEDLKPFHQDGEVKREGLAMSIPLLHREGGIKGRCSIGPPSDQKKEGFRRRVFRKVGRKTRG